MDVRGAGVNAEGQDHPARTVSGQDGCRDTAGAAARVDWAALSPSGCRLLMALRRLDMAQLRWRHLDCVQLLPLVRAAVKFVVGVRVDSAKPVAHSTDSQSREAA